MMIREPGRAPADSGRARRPHDPGLPATRGDAGTYWMMSCFPLFVVIAAVVDWSRFR